MGNFTTSYHIAEPDNIIVLTGLGIQNIKVAKSAMKWPLQKAVKVNITPENYSFTLSAMSMEKIKFRLPVTFTIGPKVLGNDFDKQTLAKYAVFMNPKAHQSNHHTINAIIEGETRVLAGQMTVEEIFNDRIKFKETVLQGVQKELDQFGLSCYNANFSELEDHDDSEYFKYMRQKATVGAQNKARCEVAHENMLGLTGETEKKTETRIKVSLLETDAVTNENKQKQAQLESQGSVQLSQSEVNGRIQLNAIDVSRKVKNAEMELQMQLDTRNLELAKDVERKRQEQLLEKLRAVELTKSTVDAEVLLKNTEAKNSAALHTADITAKVSLRNMEAEASVLLSKAKAQSEAIKLMADAELYKQTKEAEGLKAKLESESSGIQQKFKALNNDANAFIQYYMIEKEVYPKLAKENATAIQGLNPNLTIWSTGSTSGEASGDAMAPIRNLFQMFPPLLNTIQQQTGVSPPDYVVNMPRSASAVPKEVIKK